MFLLLLLFLLLPLSGSAQSTVGDPALAKQIIGTLAGSRPWSGPGDEATETNLPAATDFLFLPDGSILAAGPGSHRIYRLAADGVVRTYAGTGESGSTGDGGPKESATFSSPRALALDADGNLYVGEDAYIRKISPEGIVSTIAGNGDPTCPGLSGAANGVVGGVTRIAPGRNGEIYFLACRTVYRLAAGGYANVFLPGGDKQQARAVAELEVPVAEWKSGQVYDIVSNQQGDLYVADETLGEVYSLNEHGVVRRIAGARSTFSFPPATQAVEAHLVGIRALGLTPAGAIYVPALQLQIAVVGVDGSFAALGTAPLPVWVNGIPVSEEIAPATFRFSQTGVPYMLNTSGRIYRITDPPALHLALGYMPVPSASPTPEETLRTANLSRLAADAAGKVFVVINVPGEQGQRIFRVAPSGAVSHIAGNGEYVDSGITAPATEITIPVVGDLHAGPDGAVYFGKGTDLRDGLWRVSASGEVEAVLGGGNQLAPADLTGLNARDLSFLGDSPGFLPSAFSLSTTGEIYFRRRLPPTHDQRQFIWKVGVDGLISLVVGGAGPLTQPLDGRPSNEISVEAFNATFLDQADRLYFTHQFPGEADVRMYRLDPDGIVRLFAGNGQSTVPVAGQALAQTSLSRCTAINFVGAGEFLCLAGGLRQTWRFREGQPVALVLQAGSLPGNDGGFLGDDSAAGGLPAVNLPGGGFVARVGTSPNSSLRRTWPIPPGCTYQLSANALSVSALGQEASVTLTTGANCPWTTGTTNFWLSVDGPSFGVGPATIRFRAKPNPSYDERVSILSIAGEQVPVTQQSAVVGVLIWFSPDVLTLPGSGGDATLSIAMSGGFPWSAASPDAWITFGSGATGIGSGSLIVRAAANTTGVSRTGTVTVNGIPVVVNQPVQNGGGLPSPKLNALVEGAGFRNIPVAPGSIASLFGENLSADTLHAQSVPLPTTMQGVSFRVKSGSYSGLAGLFYTSPTQVNLLIPDDCPEGSAAMEMLAGGVVVGSLPIDVASLAPSLFSANSDGQGAPAGYTISVENGVQTRGEVYACPPQFPCEPIPVSYGAEGSEVFLILFGTGFRGLDVLPQVWLGGTEAEVTYAGPQGEFVGLDQINIRLPSAVKGMGLLRVDIFHGGLSANTVLVHF